MCGNPIAGERYQVSNKIVCGNCAAKAPSQRSWVRKLGPLGPIAVLLAKGKTLLLLVFKLKSIFSFLAFIAFYAAIFGWRYGIGIAVSILIHEMGHYTRYIKRQASRPKRPYSSPASWPTSAGTPWASACKPAPKSASPVLSPDGSPPASATCSTCRPATCSGPPSPAPAHSSTSST